MRTLYAAGAGAVVALALGLAAQPAAAQGAAADSLRAQYRLPAPPTQEVAARGRRIAPGASMAVPTAFGAGFGDAFVGVGYQAFTRAEDHPDGGFVVGFGLGSARQAVGLEVALSTFGTLRTCCRGGASFKLHRVLPYRSAIAVGWENAVTWGSLHGSDVATDAGSSLYAVASKVFQTRPQVGDPFSTLTVNFGVGDGRFRREDDIITFRERLNVFGGAALRVIEPASLIVDWTGQDLVAGASIVPLAGVPLFIAPGVADLTTRPRFILGVGYGFNYATWH
jgi:hypothetical protein